MIRKIASLCALLLAISAICAQAAGDAPPGYYQDQKVVYHNDGGAPDNAAYFHRLLNSLRNHLDAVGQEHADIRVVDHAAGVELFILAKTDQDLAAQIDTLKSRGVRFLICNNTLRERGIDWHQLYGVTEDDIVPSGVAELARLQGLG